MENHFKNSEVAKLLVSHSRNHNESNNHVSDNIFHTVKSYTFSNFSTNYSKQLDDFCIHNFSSLTKRYNQSLNQLHLMPSHAHNFYTSSFKPSTDSASSDIYPFPRNNTFNGSSTTNQTAHNDDSQLNKWPLMDLSIKKQPKKNFEMRHLLKSQSPSSSNHSKSKNSDDSNSNNGNKSNSKDENKSEKEGDQIEMFIKKEFLQEVETERGEKLLENMSVYGIEVPHEKAAVDSEQDKIEGKEVSNQKDECFTTGSSQSTENTSSSNKCLTNKDKSQSNYFSPSNHSCLQSHNNQHLSSRSSIIKTNPVITSLLLVKHTTANISPPAPAHSVKSTSTQASDRSLHKNSYSIDGSTPERTFSQPIFVNSHDKYLLSEMPPHTQTSDALRSLLMKPSSLEDTKLKLRDKQIKSKVNFPTNEKFISNLFSYDMMHKNNEKLECQDKYKKDEIYFKKEKLIKKLLVENSMHQSCGGCGCGCDFCPQPLNDKHTQEKHGDVKEIKTINGFIVSNLNVNNLDFSNNLSKKTNETERTVESLLLLKNGYRHNEQLIFSDIQKTQLLDNFCETRIYPGNNIYLYNKSQNEFNDKCFTLNKNENKDWKKENPSFEKTVLNPPSCCSSKSPKCMQKNDLKHAHLKDTSAIEAKNSTFCLSKRKFMELKNKVEDATCFSEEASQGTSCCAPKSPADDCSMPCCKRSRNATGIATNTYTRCQGACNPASCFCSGSQADCSMETCRRAFGGMPESTLDSNSLSDNSTVSVSSCKSEPEDKFTSPFSVNVSTQWSIDDLENSDLYKDFSVQCSIVEPPENTSIELEKCKLCHCCLPPKSSSLSTSLFRSSPSSSDKHSRGSLTADESDGDEIELKTQGGPLRCVHCGISFDDEVIFSIHMGSHSHQDPYTCNLCGKKCFNKYGFNTHILHGHHFVS